MIVSWCQGQVCAQQQVSSTILLIALGCIVCYISRKAGQSGIVECDGGRQLQVKGRSHRVAQLNRPQGIQTSLLGRDVEQQRQLEGST